MQKREKTMTPEILKGRGARMTEKGSVMDNVFGYEPSEQEKAYAEKLKSLDFLNFLFNVINPNEMEQYISMYLCSGEKAIE